MAKKEHRKKGGARKIGRDLAKCKRYRDSGRRESNKKRRIEKEKKRQARLKRRKERKLAHDSQE